MPVSDRSTGFQRFVRKVGALLLLLAVITVHESGHFAACHISGVAVDQFAVGFGPELASTMFLGTKFTLRLVPLGGYNEINPQSLSQANLAKKICIFMAGMLANVLPAFAVLVLLSRTLGRPKGSPSPLVRWALWNSLGIWLVTPFLALRDRGRFFAGVMGPLQTIVQISGKPATWRYYLQYFVSLSVGIAALNLIPLYPLDGGKFVGALLGAVWGQESLYVLLYILVTLVLASIIAWNILIGELRSIASSKSSPSPSPRKRRQPHKRHKRRRS
jgi:membrane-associated protease RseP (regulator of RpoE activity)